MSKYTIEVLHRGLNILTQFTRETPTRSLTELTTATGLNKTSVFRIITTLEESGFLHRDPETKRYRPGIKILQLGFTAISSLDLRRIAHPYLDQLSQQVDETVSLSVLAGLDIIYIDRVRNRQIMGVVLGMGSRLPAHCASMGKALLAHLSIDELERRLENINLVARTSNSLTTHQELRDELQRVREQGYAINNEELEVGLRAVAAPIWDHNQQVVAAMNITGSGARINIERATNELAPAVCNMAMQISRALGYTP